MNIYLAASFSLKEKTRELYQLFQEHGHTISKDWTSHKTTHPNKNPDDAVLAQSYAMEDIEGVRNCDVFVLLADGPPGTGRFIELGVAIQSQLETKKPLIYVVGEHNMDSIFYFHPNIKRKSSIEGVLEEIKDLESGHG